MNIFSRDVFVIDMSNAGERLVETYCEITFDIYI